LTPVFCADIDFNSIFDYQCLYEGVSEQSSM
jgi:hypothetical protein